MNGSWGSSCRKLLTCGALQSWRLVWSSVYLALNVYECLNSWKSMNKCKILFLVLFWGFLAMVMYLKIFKNPIFLLHLELTDAFESQEACLCCVHKMGWETGGREAPEKRQILLLSLLAFLKLKSNFCALIPSALLSLPRDTENWLCIQHDIKCFLCLTSFNWPNWPFPTIFTLVDPGS